MEIKAYKCEYCKSIHSTKIKYNSCFKHCEKKKTEYDKYKLKEDKFNELANSIRLNLTNIKDLSQELEKFFKRNYKIDITFKVETRGISNVYASHNAPIGEKTNWSGGDKNRPTHFLGWEGNISGKLNQSKKIKHPLSGKILSYMSGLFFDIPFVKGINISGGSGGNNFSYSINLFLKDFPKIEAIYDEYLLLNTFNQARVNKFIELKKLANENILEADGKIKVLKKQIEIAEIVKSKSSNAINIRRNELSQSKEYIDAIKVPKEYDFNKDRFNEIKSQFERTR